MTTLSRLRLIGAAVLVSSAAALSAAAQTQTPPPDTQTTPPAAKPEPAPTPPTGMKPAEPPKSPTMPSGQAATPDKNPLIGLTIFSSDGNKLGSVQSVDAGPDGKVKAIRFKTGGFLGFGGKLVEVPEGKFTKSGENVQLGMTSDEVSKLPEVKNQS
jgi:PRC-barrel domain